MTGRRLASIFGLVLGVISFFLPLVTVSAPPLGNEMRWSGYSIVAGLTGLGSENFYDVAAAVIYGGDETASDSGNPPKKGPSDVGQKPGALAAFTSIIAVGVSYCILLAVAITVLIKYSARTVLRFSGAGFAVTCFALVSTFILADQLQAHETGTFAAERGLVRIDVGYGLYLLVAAFALLLVLQRLAALDRLLSSPE